MNNLRVLKTWMFVMVALLSMNSYALNVKSKKFLFSKDQYIATVYLIGENHQEHLKEIIKYTKHLFRTAEFKDVAPEGIFTQVVEHRFFVGIENKVKFAIKFIDFPLNAQKNFVNGFCEDIDCDFVYRGELLDSYLLNESTEINLSSKYPLNVIKGSTSFVFEKNSPLSLKKEIVKNHNGDGLYQGIPGEILYIKKQNKNIPESKSKVLLFKKGTSIPIYGSKLNETQLEKVLSFTNGDCIIFKNDTGILTCNQTILKKTDETSFRNYYLKYADGNVHLKLEEYPHFSLINEILADTKPESMQTSENNTVVLKNKKSISPKLSESLKQISIKYHFKSEKVIETKIFGVDPTTRGKIHDIIVRKYNPLSYEIYRPSVNGEVLLSRHSLDRNRKFIKLAEADINKKFYRIGLNIKNNTNQIEAETNIQYVQRSELPATAMVSAELEGWPFRYPIGFSAAFDYYNITHESVDVDGTVTKYNGTNVDYELLGEFKKLLKDFRSVHELQLGLGYQSRNFTVEENSSIGDLAISSYVAKIQHNFHWKKFIISSALRINYLSNAEPKFGGQNSDVTSNGMGFDFGARVTKKMDKKFSAQVGFDYKTFPMTINSYEVTINDLAFLLGVSYRWGKE